MLYDLLVYDLPARQGEPAKLVDKFKLTVRSVDTARREAKAMLKELGYNPRGVHVSANRPSTLFAYRGK